RHGPGGGAPAGAPAPDTVPKLEPPHYPDGEDAEGSGRPGLGQRLEVVIMGVSVNGGVGEERKLGIDVGPGPQPPAEQRTPAKHGQGATVELLALDDTGSVQVGDAQTGLQAAGARRPDQNGGQAQAEQN